MWSICCYGKDCLLGVGRIVDGSLDEWIKLVNEWMDRWVNGWMDQWMDGLTGQWVGGSMDRWVDWSMGEWINRWTG